MTDDPHLGDLVFVYGTLRSGFINNDATIAFRKGAELICEGWLPGYLYSTGWYPALKEEGPGKVKGEVWKLTVPGTMHILDDYEGIDEVPPEYDRVQREVQTDTGSIKAWVYIYNDDVDPLQQIPSGDWTDAFIEPGDISL